MILPGFNSRKNNALCEIRRLNDQLEKLQNKSIKDACFLSELSFEVAALRSKVSQKQNQGIQGGAVMVQKQILQLQKERDKLDKAIRKLESNSELLGVECREMTKQLLSFRHQGKHTVSDCNKQAMASAI